MKETLRHRVKGRPNPESGMDIGGGDSGLTSKPKVILKEFEACGS